MSLVLVLGRTEHFLYPFSIRPYLNGRRDDVQNPGGASPLLLYQGHSTGVPAGGGEAVERAAKGADTSGGEGAGSSTCALALGQRPAGHNDRLQPPPPSQPAYNAHQASGVHGIRGVGCGWRWIGQG